MCRPELMLNGDDVPRAVVIFQLHEDDSDTEDFGPLDDPAGGDFGPDNEPADLPLEGGQAQQELDDAEDEEMLLWGFDEDMRRPVRTMFDWISTALLTLSFVSFRTSYWREVVADYEAGRRIPFAVVHAERTRSMWNLDEIIISLRDPSRFSDDRYGRYTRYIMHCEFTVRIHLSVHAATVPGSEGWEDVWMAQQIHFAVPYQLYPIHIVD